MRGSSHTRLPIQDFPQGTPTITQGFSAADFLSAIQEAVDAERAKKEDS